MIATELASTYLESTVAYGFATGYGAHPAPWSFYSAMHDNTSAVIVALKCKDHISDKLCNFDDVKPPMMTEEIQNRWSSEVVYPIESHIEFIEPNHTSVCNMKSGRCDYCDPVSSGSGCINAT